jgi:hypothetical protein
MMRTFNEMAAEALLVKRVKLTAGDEDVPSPASPPPPDAACDGEFAAEGEEAGADDTEQRRLLEENHKFTVMVREKQHRTLMELREWDEVTGISHRKSENIENTTMATPTPPSFYDADVVSAQAFENHTPHDVHLFAKDKKTLLHTFKAGSSAIRLTNNPTDESSFLGLPSVPRQTYSGISGVPQVDLSAGAKPPALIVALLIGEYIGNNPATYPGMVIGPDTSPQGVVRDEKGGIAGTTRFVVYKGDGTA